MPQRVSLASVRALMREHSLSAVDIAKIINVRPQTVRAYLCGAREFPARRYIRLMSHLLRAA